MKHEKFLRMENSFQGTRSVARINKVFNLAEAQQYPGPFNLESHLSPISHTGSSKTDKKLRRTFIVSKTSVFFYGMHRNNFSVFFDIHIKSETNY